MPPQIICTSQQSRFHTDTLATSNEIDLKSVNISIGKTDLLVDCHLRLKAGVRYGLLGRNGSGKSTLFTALRDDLIPGLPSNVKITLVSQTLADSFGEAGEEGSKQDDTTVLDRVITMDRVRTRTLKQFEELSAAVESHSSSQIQRAVSAFELFKIREDYENKKKIAMRRSGARGKAARLEEDKAELRLKEAEESFANMSLNVVVDPLTQALSHIADLQQILESVDYQTTTSRAGSILAGLAFTPEMIAGPYKDLSGGWRSRAALAGALLLQSDVLLLDEPNNFLDLPTTMWLEMFLTEQVDGRTVVMTSHDQEFLNRVVEETIYIRGQKLRYFEGTPLQLEIFERKDLKHKQKQQAALDKKRAHVESSIQKGRSSAKKTGDDNRARMAAQRQRKLDERWGLEVNAKGHRFKLNRDLVGYALTSRAGVQFEEQEQVVRLCLPEAPQLRTTGDLVTFDKVSFRYPKAKKPLLEDVTFSLAQGGRMAFIGANGHGKSTLANLIVGALKPSSGKITTHPQLKIGHYGQHSVEHARRRAVQYFLDYFEKLGEKVEEGEARACLGTLGLGGRAMGETPVEGLSGGQKVRLAFSLIVFRPPPLLLLDEITTHLDLGTIRALARALRKFTGSIILITHDRWFCKVVIELAPFRGRAGAGSDEDEDEEDEDEDEDEEGEGEAEVGGKKGKVYRVWNGRVGLLEGGMEEYVTKVERGMTRRMRLAQGK